MGRFIAAVRKFKAPLLAILPVAAIFVPHDKVAAITAVAQTTTDLLINAAGAVGAIGAALASAPKDHK